MFIRAGFIKEQRGVSDMAGKRRPDKAGVDYRAYGIDTLHREARYYKGRGMLGEVGVISHELNRRRKDRGASGMYPYKF
jgi:hypothetical protein